MKKLHLLLVFLACLGALTSAYTQEQEEIDFLLFLPNSSDGFVNEKEAVIQLDKLAEYLKGRNPGSGQIVVYGYAANAVNDIEPINLSKERARFVMNELQKRGIQQNLFSDPVGHGAVDLCGANTSEEDRIPNRRVRILLNGEILTPVTMKAAEPVIPAPVAEKEDSKSESGFKFPWMILLLLLLLALLAALFYLLSKRKKRTGGEAVREPAPLPAAVVKPAVVNEPIAAAPVMSEKVVNLEEEIRFRAYELSLERNGQNGDMDGDWYTALPDVCARYEADGYRVYIEDGCWWARKSFAG